MEWTIFWRIILDHKKPSVILSYIWRTDANWIRIPKTPDFDPFLNDYCPNRSGAHWEMRNEEIVGLDRWRISMNHCRTFFVQYEVQTCDVWDVLTTETTKPPWGAWSCHIKCRLNNFSKKKGRWKGWRRPLRNLRCKKPAMIQAAPSSLSLQATCHEPLSHLFCPVRGSDMRCVRCSHNRNDKATMRSLELPHQMSSQQLLTPTLESSGLLKRRMKSKLQPMQKGKVLRFLSKTGLDECPAIKCEKNQISSTLRFCQCIVWTVGKVCHQVRRKWLFATANHTDRNLLGRNGNPWVVSPFWLSTPDLSLDFPETMECLGFGMLW